MVRIFNVVQTGNIISCNYIPETSEMSGYIEIDKTTREIKNIEYSEYEYGKKMYVAQVRSKICEFVNTGNPMPKEITAIWY